MQLVTHKLTSKNKTSDGTGSKSCVLSSRRKGKLTTIKELNHFMRFLNYGFIMSLRYTNNPATNGPYFSKSEVDAMLANMISGTNGLWDIDTLGAKLEYIAQIATKFGFTVTQAATVN
jgi:hypothetical protein